MLPDNLLLSLQTYLLKDPIYYRSFFIRNGKGTSLWRNSNFTSPVVSRPQQASWLLLTAYSYLLVEVMMEYPFTFQRAHIRLRCTFHPARSSGGPTYLSTRLAKSLTFFDRPTRFNWSAFWLQERSNSHFGKGYCHSYMISFFFDDSISIYGNIDHLEITDSFGNLLQKEGRKRVIPLSIFLLYKALLYLFHPKNNMVMLLLQMKFRGQEFVS